MRFDRFFLATATLGLSACSLLVNTSPYLPHDAATPPRDASRSDAGPLPDGFVPGQDAGMQDGGPPDAGSTTTHPVILMLLGSFEPGGITAIAQIDLETAALADTAVGPAGAGAIVLDPDGTSFWLSGYPRVERRSIQTLGVLDTVTIPFAANAYRDLAINPATGMLYVGGEGQMGVVDTASRTLVSMIDLAGDGTISLAISPDGNEVVATTTNSSLLFVDTASESVTQRVTATGYPYDVMHLGDVVVTWDDNSEAFTSYYNGGGWSAGPVISFPPDGGASFNAQHNMVFNPTDGRVYFFEAITPNIIGVDPRAPSINRTYPIGMAYVCLLVEADGSNILGVHYDGTALNMDRIDIASGAYGSAGIDLSAAPAGIPQQLVLASYP